MGLNEKENHVNNKIKQPRLHTSCIHGEIFAHRHRSHQHRISEITSSCTLGRLLKLIYIYSLYCVDVIRTSRSPGCRSNRTGARGVVPARPRNQSDGAKETKGCKGEKSGP